MQALKLILILPLLALFTSLQAQTDSSVVKVDSAFLVPGKPTQKDTVDQDSIRLLGAPKVNVPPPATRKPAKDTVVKDSARLAIESMPRKAVLRSAIIPGWGQIYNRRWWKVPLVYGGFVGIGLVYEFNRRYYREFLAEAQYRQLNGKPKDPRYAPYSDQGILDAKDYYRRNRDLSILGAIAFHAIQIIDAYVDAKFFRYDISDELSFKVEPSITTQSVLNAYTPIPSIKFKLSL